MQDHLVLIDGHHLLYRAYWAIPRTMKTSKGEQVNMPFGVLSMLLQIMSTEQPTHLLFCFDAAEQTFRHQAYDAYKAGRAETPDDFRPQIPRTLGLIDAFGASSVSGFSLEADDFMACFATLAEAQGMRVTIVSGDKDLLQLVSPTTRVAIPHKGYQAPEYMDPASVQAKFGIEPADIPSYKGLIGDASDNLPGVLGIGPKAALALLQSYGSLRGIYDHLDEIKPSWRTKLAADREHAFFSESMATLVRTLPSGCSLCLDDLRLHALDIGRFQQELQAVEFHLILRRLQQLAKSPYGQQIFSGVLATDVATSPSISQEAPLQEQMSLFV